MRVNILNHPSLGFRVSCVTTVWSITIGTDDKNVMMKMLETLE